MAASMKMKMASEVSIGNIEKYYRQYSSAKIIVKAAKTISIISVAAAK